jgi:hypothetical protein
VAGNIIFAPLSFSQIWHAGRRVQELALPRRKGTIKFVQGSGFRARITVNLDGGTPAIFFPAQLTPL